MFFNSSRTIHSWFQIILFFITAHRTFTDAFLSQIRKFPKCVFFFFLVNLFRRKDFQLYQKPFSSLINPVVFLWSFREKSHYADFLLVIVTCSWKRKRNFLLGVVFFYCAHLLQERAYHTKLFFPLPTLKPLKVKWKC